MKTIGPLLAALLAAAPALAFDTKNPQVVEGDGIRLEFDGHMRSRVVSTLGAPTVLGPFENSETLDPPMGAGLTFLLDSAKEDPVQDTLGSGQRVTLIGHAGSLTKRVEVTRYADRPHFLFLRVRYTNEDQKPFDARGYTNHRYTFDAASKAEPAFWSYQPASYEKRPDWVLPVPPGFTQRNFLGMNDSDYGGGTPVLDVWRRDVGLAIGHIELVPKQIALPVKRGKDGVVQVALTADRPIRLQPGASFETPRTFVAVHTGDAFATLRAYSEVMQKQGLVIPEAPADAFRPLWCAWGYGRKFTPEQVYATLPIAKTLGFGWAVLDDGWQVAEGDWTPVPSKFPKGDADMKAMVDRIHAQGFKAQLWWAPLAADPGSRTDKEHPDWLLKNVDGSPRKVTWWDSNYLCPALGAVREDAAAFARHALGVWGFDGLKIDGQHLNGAPPCFNPDHHHADPDDAPEGVPGFFKAIWDAAQATKPGALVEICPCGTAYSFFNLPYMNMAVASDPESSWQVRSKGKTLKALAGDRIAFFGDHVEMSEGGTDFASTYGIGGVIGTNFAWPGAPGEKDKTLLLSPEREKLWGEWTKRYDAALLPKGEYLGGLYDIGFDKPEAHAVRKDGAVHYAFFAKSYKGKVELRGLEAREYRVTDTVSGKDLGRVRGPVAALDVRFEKSLLVAARPEAGATAQNWTHRVRIGAYGLGEKADPAAIVRDATADHVFGIEVDNDVTGRYESFLDPTEKLAAIKDVAARAHAAGNHAFVYIAGTECITKDADQTPHSLAKDHPDWLQRKRSGEPASFTSGAAFWIAKGDEDVWISPYATAWRTQYMERVRQIAATGIDGIYVDIPYWMTHFEGWEDSWASFDDYTVEAFRKKTGLDARRDFALGDLADPKFRKWVDFRIETITEFMREIDQNAKSVNPKIMTIPEIYPGIEREAVVVGSDVYELYAVTDAIAHEYEFGGGDHMASSRTPLDWFRYQIGMHSFRAFAEGKATWILNYSWDGDKNIAPPEPMMNLAMSVVMAGANFWDAATHVMSGTNDTPTRRRIFEWIGTHEDTLYHPRQPIHPVGVYFSPKTRDYFPDAFLRSYQGILILLMQKHVEFQVVTPRTLAAFRGDTLVLPDVRELSDAERGSLRALQARGGRLVVTGVDATGLPATTFPDCPGRAYLAALEKDFDAADAKPADALMAALAPDARVRIEASPAVATQIARVDGKLHVFFASFKGLVSKHNAVQVPEKGVRIRLAVDGDRKGWFLPFLGAPVEIHGTRDGRDLVFALPELQKGAVVWFEDGTL